MALETRYCFLAILAICLVPVCSDRAVSIKSKFGQSLTSSTLLWMPVDGTTPDLTAKFLDDAIQAGEIGTEVLYVCRTRHSGLWFIGSSDGTGCNIVFYDAVHTYNKHEILINQQRSGRVVWSPWDRSRIVPIGAVENGGYYVARRQDVDGNIYVGRLDLSASRGKIYIAEQGSVREFVDGEILVEHEASQYNIQHINVISNRRKIHKDEIVVVGETILANQEQAAAATIARSLDYTLHRSVYLGHVKGMIKALPSSIEISDEIEPLKFQWGNAATKNSTRLIDLSYVLEYGTAVNITILGRSIDFEAPYTALLETTYTDQHKSKRHIEGTTKQRLVEDIRVEYSKGYFINNGSVIPTTTTTTSTTASTTTAAATSSSSIAKTTNDHLSSPVSLDMSGTDLSDDPRVEPISQPDNQHAKVMKGPKTTPTSSSCRSTVNLLLLMPMLFTIR